MTRVFTYTILVSSLFAALLSAERAQAEQPNPNSDDPIKKCIIIKQPPGSAIRACCGDTFCYICDEYWDDCVVDRYGGRKPGAKRPIFQPSQPAKPRPRKPVMPSAGTFQGNQSLIPVNPKVRDNRKPKMVVRDNRRRFIRR